jgi:hypothetical protein
MIWALIFSLLGSGQIDVFYIDKIEQGVNKNVTDKDRKKELKIMLEEYTKAVKKYNKSRKSDIELLKKKR